MTGLSRILPLLMLPLFLLTTAGCDDPCGELEKKVCSPKTRTERKLFKRHCDLMKEPARRESLQADVCTSILDHLSKN